MILQGSPILPVLTFEEPKTAVAVCRALIRGGIGALEVTLRTARAFEVLQTLRQEFPSVPLGAGTVVDSKQLEVLQSLGVDFLVTPGLTPRLADALEESGLVTLPGVATPSEAMAARERGYQYLKLFPAGPMGGIAAVKAFAAILPDVRFCPTGGVCREDLPTYLTLEGVIAVGGSWLVDLGKTPAPDLGAIERCAREDMAVARRYQRKPGQATPHS